MLNLLGRARKGSTFSPSEGGGYKLPPGRGGTTAPNSGRRPPAKPSKRVPNSYTWKTDADMAEEAARRSEYDEWIERQKRAYRRAERKELDQRLNAYNKIIDQINEVGMNGPLSDTAFGEMLDAAVGLTPLGMLKDGILFWNSFQPAQPAGYDMEGAGFIRLCTEPGAFQKMAWYGASGMTPLCATPFQVPSGDYGAPIGANAGTVLFGPSQFGGSRYRVAEHWTRPATATGVAPQWKPAQPEKSVTYVLPPEPQLPGRAMQRDLTPHRGRLPAPKPYQRPAVVTATSVGGRGSTTLGYHNVMPPGKGTKEIKTRRRNALGGLIGAVTEGVEWVDMLHDNLPKKMQASGDYDRFGNYKGKGKGDPTPQQKAAAVYRNINHVDMNGLFVDIVKNHFEDKFFGMLGKAGGKLARENGWLAGPQAGYGL